MSHWRLHPDLPIFGLQNGTRCAVYVPGHVMPAPASLLEELRLAYSEGTYAATSRLGATAAARLVRAAKAAREEWRQLFSGPFLPVCLSIQLPFRCNLLCAYCYARSGTGEPREVEPFDRNAVLAAAGIVSKHCAVRHLPLHLVVQGLGEPTLRWDDLLWCVDACRSAATAAGISWSGHLTSNGQCDAGQAEWVGKTFSHVTISCDGPPDIQDVARPRCDGTPSSARLADSIAAIGAGGAALEARVTITDRNAERLREVIGYIAQVLGIRAIRMEPAFGFGSRSLARVQPEKLANDCIEASDLGASMGVEVCFASPLLTQVHAEYCDVLRQTLRLSPEGTATNCLHGVGATCPRACSLGRYDRASGLFRMDEAASVRALAVAARVPSECGDCINVYHCARSCPDDRNEDPAPWGFRCRFQRHLAESWILRAATATPHEMECPRTVASPAERKLREEVEALPGGTDRDVIMADTLRALRAYTLEHHTMPAPAWSRDEHCVKRTGAVDVLFSEGRNRHGAASLYVHLPFCRRKCVFCDCHSVLAGRGRGERHAEYVSRLVSDLDLWTACGGAGDRAITTVHLGGGTPDAIGYPLMAKLCTALRDRMAITSETEWAVETTSEGAVPEGIDHLLRLGFRRLHVGVQTLNDDLRRSLGRASGAAAVLSRLWSAMGRGMVTSVDLLYGLPTQDAGMLLADLAQLADIGIHGVSLYRLNLSPRNRGMLRVFQGFQQDPLRECVMLQAAEQFLVGAGYRKNHHVHYALEKDGDLYFRHAVRGEDLIAIGASASGAIGPWEYRCELYPGYVGWEAGRLPVIDLAMDRLAPDWLELAARLMAGWVPREASPPGAASLVHGRWSDAGLLVPEGGGYRLSAIGAWLLGTMLRELRETAAAATGND